MGGNPLSAGVGWPSKLWAGTASPQGGILDNTAGPPLIDFQGTIPYNSIGQNGWPNFGFETNNRWQFSDDLSWQRGKHTIKVGFEYRWHQFPHVGWGVGDVGGHFVFNNLETAGYDASGNVLPGDTGNSFASMLLGQVHNSDQTIPVHPAFHESYYAPWINDEWKVNTRLTLTLGLRWEFYPPFTPKAAGRFHLRSERSQSGRWRNPRRHDFRRLWPGPCRNAHV